MGRTKTTLAQQALYSNQVPTAHDSIIGANATPGHPDNHKPYRNEIGGIFAIVVIVDAIVRFHNLSHSIIELGCDCQSSLTAIFEHEYDTPSQPHYNLIHEIRLTLAASPITWTFHHILDTKINISTSSGLISGLSSM
jgi:hypothetical protein